MYKKSNVIETAKEYLPPSIKSIDDGFRNSQYQDCVNLTKPADEMLPDNLLKIEAYFRMEMYAGCVNLTHPAKEIIPLSVTTIDPTFFRNLQYNMDTFEKPNSFNLDELVHVLPMKNFTGKDEEPYHNFFTTKKWKLSGKCPRYVLFNDRKDKGFMKELPVLPYNYPDLRDTTVIVNPLYYHNISFVDEDNHNFSFLLVSDDKEPYTRNTIGELLEQRGCIDSKTGYGGFNQGSTHFYQPQLYSVGKSPTIKSYDVVNQHTVTVDGNVLFDNVSPILDISNNIIYITRVAHGDIKEDGYYTNLLGDGYDVTEFGHASAPFEKYGFKGIGGTNDRNMFPAYLNAWTESFNPQVYSGEILNGKRVVSGFDLMDIQFPNHSSLFFSKIIDVHKECYEHNVSFDIPGENGRVAYKIKFIVYNNSSTPMNYNTLLEYLQYMFPNSVVIRGNVVDKHTGEPYPVEVGIGYFDKNVTIGLRKKLSDGKVMNIYNKHRLIRDIQFSNVSDKVVKIFGGE
jgi:hypothetical protein